MTKEEKARTLEQNYVEMTGRINFIEIKYSQGGTAYTRALMSKKAVKGDDYDTFPFTFFGDVAEEFADKIQKGDYVNIVGVINCDKYEKDGKKIERVTLVGRHFVKAEYDEDAKCYVPAKGKKVPWA